MTDPSPAFPAAGAADFEQTVLAASAERPVLVDFWADWCAPCKALEPVLQRIQQELGERLRVVKVNADEEAGLAAQLGIRGLPTLMLFSDGQPVGQLVGVQPDGNILAMIAPYLVSRAANLVREAQTCAEQGDTPRARQLLREAVALEPDNSAALRALIPLEVLAGQSDQAEQLHGQLIRTDREGGWGVALATLIELARLAGEQADVNALQQRVQQSPEDPQSRAALAAALILAGEHQRALDELIELLRLDKNHQDELARRGLLAVFELEGDNSPLANEYRRKMAAALH